MNAKELTQSILACIVVAGAVASLFLVVNDVAAQSLRTLAGVVVGYYFGASTLPAFGRRG